jgi:hypothetical protein
MSLLLDIIIIILFLRWDSYFICFYITKYQNTHGTQSFIIQIYVSKKIILHFQESISPIPLKCIFISQLYTPDFVK